jgi:hypothetical protein
MIARGAGIVGGSLIVLVGVYVFVAATWPLLVRCFEVFQ